MVKKEDSIFIKLLKKYTIIDENFIDTFFKKFKIGGELNYEIEDKDIAKYLGISLDTLRNRLRNKYSKNKRFFEKVDYLRIKEGNKNSVKYMLNYQCFEKLAMSGDSKNSETVRMYFVKLREFITENQNLIYQALENKNDLEKYTGFETIYFFAVDDKKQNIFKVGRTSDIIQRLRNYNVGRIKEVDLKYLAIVTNSLVIEKCIKLKLKDKQVIQNKEIYNVEPKTIKKIITDCYCKEVPDNKKQNLYEELSNLLGIYAYTKDKTTIKPYVLIGKDL